MKVLVIRFSSLGDCVLLCPFLSHLHAHGADEVTIATKSAYAELFSACPGSVGEAVRARSGATSSAAAVRAPPMVCWFWLCK